VFCKIHLADTVIPDLIRSSVPREAISPRRGSAQEIETINLNPFPRRGILPSWPGHVSETGLALPG